MFYQPTSSCASQIFFYFFTNISSEFAKLRRWFFHKRNDFFFFFLHKRKRLDKKEDRIKIIRKIGKDYVDTWWNWNNYFNIPIYRFIYLIINQFCPRNTNFPQENKLFRKPNSHIPRSTHPRTRYKLRYIRLWNNEIQVTPRFKWNFIPNAPCVHIIFFI